MNVNIINDNAEAAQNEFGTAGHDLFVYKGTASNYSFQAYAGGGIIVWNLASGEYDILQNVETIQFDDVAYDFVGGSFVQVALHDVNQITSTAGTNDVATAAPDAGLNSGEQAHISTADVDVSSNGSVNDAYSAAGSQIYVPLPGGDLFVPGNDFVPPSVDYPPVDTGCVPGVEVGNHVFQLEDGDKDVKAEFDFKIKAQELTFKMELKLKDGELVQLGEDFEFADIDTSHLIAAMTGAGVQNIEIDKIEVKDDKIKLEIKGNFALSKEDAENIELYLPNAIDLPITLSDGSHDKEICVVIEPEFDAHSPIALDMNGDGVIGVTGETSSIDKDVDAQLGQTVEFDIDADGKLDTIEWFDGSGDGILVDLSKIKSDGSIDGSALFGDEGGRFNNGYEKLQGHDDNSDGIISNDELDGLGLWIDDGDAVLEAGELMSAQEAGVAGISTAMTLVQDDDGKNLMQSSATLTDGTSVMTEDVWFDTAAAEEIWMQTHGQEMETCCEMDMDGC